MLIDAIILFFWNNDMVLLSAGQQTVAQHIWWAFTTTKFLDSDSCVGTIVILVIIVCTCILLFSFTITELKFLIENCFQCIYINWCVYMYVYIYLYNGIPSQLWQICWAHNRLLIHHAQYLLCIHDFK